MDNLNWDFFLKFVIWKYGFHVLVIIDGTLIEFYKEKSIDLVILVYYKWTMNINKSF